MGSTSAPDVADRALAASIGRAGLTRTLSPFLCARVFHEGAENCAWGRAGLPPTSLFGAFVVQIRRTSDANYANQRELIPWSGPKENW